MNIILPSRLNRASMTSLLNQVISKEGQPLYSEYVFEFNNCRRFIEPIGVTFLNNLVKWLLSENIKVTFSFTDPTDKSIWENRGEPQRFLDDCGFFEMYLHKKIFPSSSLRDTTVPLQNVSMDNFHQWLETNFIPWIASSINKEVEELATFKASIEEIFNNVRDHAEKDNSCVFAQHFPQNNTLTISIADIGVGIIEHIKSNPNYSHFTNEEAMRSSVKNKFTTKSTPKNRGAGLDVLVHNIVMNAAGSVYIFANSGILECKNVDNTLVYNYQEADHYYPGTHIEIQIDIGVAGELFDTIEEEFAW